MDKADSGTSYEIMILTANNNGQVGNWTLTRGAENSQIHAHNANWTLVPVLTAGGVYGAFGYACELVADFSGAANTTQGQALPNAATGQPWSLYSANANSDLYVASGRVTYADADYLGAYATAKLQGQAIRVGGSFAFTSWTVTGGCAVLAITAADIASTEGQSLGLPQIPVHLILAPDSWSLGYIATQGGSIQYVVQNTGYTANVANSTDGNGHLIADGTTLHYAEIVLDQANGIVYVTLPDGETYSFQNSNFEIAADYFFFEAYRPNNTAGETKPLWRNVWADSKTAAVIPAARQRAATTRSVFATEFPGTASNMVLNTTDTTVPGTTVTYTVPESGSVLVRVEGLVDCTVAGPVHFGLHNGSGALIAVRTVSTKVTNGRFSVTFGLQQGTVGQQETISMCAYVGSGTTASLLIGQQGTPTQYDDAAITVTPI